MREVQPQAACPKKTVGISCATEGVARTHPGWVQSRHILVPAQASSLLETAQLSLKEVGLKAAFLLYGAGEE